MEQQYAYPDIEIQNLLKGLPPGKSELLKSLSTGLDSLTEFLTDQYLQEYIPSGGSKIKFVTGRPGSGKTHLGLRLIQEARDRNYLTVSFSAKEVWLHDFREIYLELFRQCGIERILEGCAGQIVKELGYDPGQIRPGQNFMDFLSERNEADAIARGEIRGALRRFFTRNPLLDNTFACCCSLLTGSILGHPVLEQGNKELILAYMSGDKTVRLSQLRALGLSPSRITKYNARNLLRSLAETAKLGGFAGIIVVIDDMEELLRRTSDNPIRYTRLRREDAYESIRQLIDDIDSMRYLMFFLCFDRELIDDENYGVKSYQALWMRIQNEVVSSRFNRFADIVDMDRYGDEFYTAPVLIRMADKLADTLEACNMEAFRIDEGTVESLTDRSVYGGIGLPYLVNRFVVEGGEKDV